MKWISTYAALFIVTILTQSLWAQTWSNPYQERLNQYMGKDYEQAETDLKSGKPVKILGLNDYSPKWGAPLEQFTDVEQVIISMSKIDSAQLPAIFEQLSRLPNLKYLNLSIANGPQDMLRIPAGLDKLNNLEVLSLRMSGNVNISTILAALPLYKNLLALQLEFPHQQTDFPAVLRECKSLKLLSVTVPPEMTLPMWLGEIKSLEYLTLYGRFSDSGMKKQVLPDFLSGLTSLKSLEITNFKIKSSDFKGLSESLQHVSIINCILSESDDLITAINRCKRLESLYIKGNMLSPFSATTAIELPNLKELILSELYVDSLRKQPISNVPNFTQSTHLKVLCLEKVLGETAPKEIEQLANLERLTLAGNRLTQLPNLGKMLNLKYLIAPSNQLKEIPKSIGKLTKLITLNIAQNQLNELPEGLSNATELQFAFLSNNNLVTLPSEFSKLKKLRGLSVNDNQLTELPKNIGGCSNLQNLQLINNSLVALPNSIGQLKSLSMLNVSHNPLTKLPETLGDCDSLQTLILGNCQLENLPNSIGNLQRLNYLNIADAENVPGNYRQIKGDTRYLSKNHNRLQYLPTSLANCRKLTTLDLSRNKHWDEKVFWSVIQQLSMPFGTLNLTDCNLDSIPMLGWKNTQIRNLQLGNNKISQFPTDWFKAKGIQTIVLTNNKLAPPLTNQYFVSFEERLLLGEEMGIDVPKPFPKTKEMARAYMSQAGKKINTGDVPRFIEYMKEVQRIDSTEGRYNVELWSRFFFHTHQYRRAIDSFNVVVERYFKFEKERQKSYQTQQRGLPVALYVDLRGQSKWQLGDSLGAIKDYELLVNDYKLFAPNLWGCLGVWYKRYRPTAGKSGAAFDKAISMYEAVRNQPPMVQLSAAEVYFMNDQADKAYEYLFGLDKTNFKPDEKLLADYLLLCTQIAQKQAGEDEVISFEKLLKSQNIQIKNWSYQLFEEALNSAEIAPEQKTLLKRLTASTKTHSLVVD